MLSAPSAEAGTGETGTSGAVREEHELGCTSFRVVSIRVQPSLPARLLSVPIVSLCVLLRSNPSGRVYLRLNLWYSLDQSQPATRSVALRLRERLAKAAGLVMTGRLRTSSLGRPYDAQWVERSREGQRGGEQAPRRWLMAHPNPLRDDRAWFDPRNSGHDAGTNTAGQRSQSGFVTAVQGSP